MLHAYPKTALTTLGQLSHLTEFYNFVEANDSFCRGLVINGFWTSAKYASKYRSNGAGVSMAGNLLQYLGLALPFSSSKYGWMPSDELRAMFRERAAAEEPSKTKWSRDKALLVDQLIDRVLAHLDPVERHIGEVFCKAALISLQLISTGNEDQEVPSPKLLELVRQARNSTAKQNR